MHDALVVPLEDDGMDDDADGGDEPDPAADDDEDDGDDDAADADDPAEEATHDGESGCTVGDGSNGAAPSLLLAVLLGLRRRTWRARHVGTH
jgi:MYXO-CTERM domain-containing protein